MFAFVEGIPNPDFGLPSLGQIGIVAGEIAIIIFGLEFGAAATLTPGGGIIPRVEDQDDFKSFLVDVIKKRVEPGKNILPPKNFLGSSGIDDFPRAKTDTDDVERGAKTGRKSVDVFLKIADVLGAFIEGKVVFVDMGD